MAPTQDGTSAGATPQGIGTGCCCFYCEGNPPACFSDHRSSPDAWHRVEKLCVPSSISHLAEQTELSVRNVGPRGDGKRTSLASLRLSDLSGSRLCFPPVLPSLGKVLAGYCLCPDLGSEGNLPSSLGEPSLSSLGPLPGCLSFDGWFSDFSASESPARPDHYRSLGLPIPSVSDSAGLG